MPEPPATRPDDRTPWPQWPLILRTWPAHEEGGARQFSVSTTEFVGENGRVVAMRGHEVGPPPSFEKIDGSEFEIPADLVLLAMGFLHTEHDGLIEQWAVDVDPRGNVEAGEFAPASRVCSPRATPAAASRSWCGRSARAARRPGRPTRTSPGSARSPARIRSARC